MDQNPALSQIFRGVQQNQPIVDPTQVDPAQTPQPTGGNGLLGGILPFVGGVAGAGLGALIPGLGETGIGEIGGGAVGQAAGDWLAQAISGKPIDMGEVATTGGLGLALGGIGLGAGKLLPGILKAGGEEVATGGLNLTQPMKNAFAKKFSQPIEQTILDAKVPGADVNTLTSKVIDPLNQAYGQAVSKNPFTVDPMVLQNNFDRVRNEVLGEAPTTQAQGVASSLDNEFGNAVKNLGLNLTSDGKIAEGNAPISSDILHKWKSQFDSQTSSASFNRDAVGADLNRNMGSVFRSTLNDGADQAGISPAGKPLSDLGRTIQRLSWIQGKAMSRQGVGQSLTGVRQLVKSGVAGGLTSLLGLGPLTGAIAEPVAENIARNPMVAGPLSKVLMGAGGAIANNVPKIAGAATLGGGALAGALFSGQSIPPNGNGQQPNNQQGNLPQGQNQVNNQTPGNIPQQDENGNFQLPSLMGANTEIPGQIYPVELQAQDLQRVGQLPFYMQDAAINAIRAKSQANDGIIQQYMQTHQLQPNEIGFMQTAGQTNEQMNTLRQLINEKGNANAFEAILNDSPQVQRARSLADPTYGTMLSLMSQIQGASARAIQGGRPSNFDWQVMSGAMPSAGDTKAGALAKLDQIQKFLVDNYTRQLPYYGYTQRTQGLAAQQAQAQAQQSPVPANLMSILGLGQAPAQQ